MTGAMTTTMGRFVLRAAGLTLIAGAVAMVSFYREEGWGPGTVPCFLWAMLWAVVLGVIGFRSMRQVFEVPPREMLRVVALGVILRLFVLVASQVAVYLVIDKTWGARTLLSTMVFYLLVLGVEVYSLLQEWKGGAARPQGAGEEAKLEP